MSQVQNRYGIPNVELKCVNGRTFNPAAFVGHHLVVLFLPADQATAMREVSSYEDRAKHFSDIDAWLLPVAPTEEAFARLAGLPHPLTVDPAGQAWAAFERLLKLPTPPERAAGAVYLFGRGGGLQRAWFGMGHVDEVVRELQSHAW